MDLIARGLAQTAKTKTDKITVNNNVDLDNLVLLNASLTQYTTVAAVENVFTLDAENSAYKNFASTSADAVAKTVAVDNIPSGRCELVWELTYTEAAAITWFSGIAWQGSSAPSLTAGKTYAFLFQTSDGGAAWRGTSVEW